MTRLSLELVCGSSGVGPEHEGYFDPSESLTHPGHAAVADWARSHGITANVSYSLQDGVWYSDAYLYFEPRQVVAVANALKAIGHRGDILDIRGRLSRAERSAVNMVAQREGWKVED